MLVDGSAGLGVAVIVPRYTILVGGSAGPGVAEMRCTIIHKNIFLLLRVTQRCFSFLLPAKQQKKKEKKDEEQRKKK